MDACRALAHGCLPHARSWMPAARSLMDVCRALAHGCLPHARSWMSAARSLRICFAGCCWPPSPAAALVLLWSSLRVSAWAVAHAGLSNSRMRAARARQWHIQACCALTGEGMEGGLDWLSRRIQARIPRTGPARPAPLPPHRPGPARTPSPAPGQHPMRTPWHTGGTDGLAACCLLLAACCLLPAACCLLLAACYLLLAACCLLLAFCCLLPAACCLLQRASPPVC
jgi:hypothetical protein